MDQTEAELESFRRQWREEVSARNRPRPHAAAERQTPQRAPVNVRQPPKASARPSAPTDVQQDARNEGDEWEPRAYHDVEEKADGRRLGDGSSSHPKHRSSKEKEPSSALEHYEKAVERESQGSLGDSVSLYRKAFRLDSRVHEAYKNKHFPPSAIAPAKPANPNPSNAPTTVPNPAHRSLHGPPSSVPDLIQSFSSLTIASLPPPTDASPAPPCPLAELPEEILVDILLYTAIIDVASFARLAQVCKRLAYLVTTEERVWRRVAQGHEFGFAAMHYRFACDIQGLPILDATSSSSSDEDGDDASGHVLGVSPCDSSTTSAPTSLFLPTVSLTPTYPTYRHLFRLRPRLRFNGVYISTVNYSRPGSASPTQLTWNSPVLIVTYYRYLRFFRDGTAISLLTTAEPADVLPWLHWEHVGERAGGGGGGGLPSAVMKDALRGRWRLSGSLAAVEDDRGGKTSAAGSAAASTTGPPAKGTTARRAIPEQQAVSSSSSVAGFEAEGDVHVETEGVVPKYMYRLQLGLSSAGRGGARNNKLVWKGYWSYNRLTDDWAEFGLKNDRAFYWSRVKSYGTGL